MRCRRRRHGVALMLVVAVLAVASVMSFVMLSSATLQNRAGANHAKLATAEYLAESGINIAMYYIQYPQNAPSLNADGYWPGTAEDLDMGDGVKLGIGVTRDVNDDCTYEVTTTATVGPMADTRVTRTTGAKIYLRNQFEVTKAAAFNSDTQLSAGTTITGDVWSSKNLSLRTGTPLPLISGIGHCKTYTTGGLYLFPSSGFRIASPPSPGAPTVNEINLYKTYKYGNAQYNADVISGATLTSGMSLGPTASNPAGIYYSATTIEINSDVTIHGTLVVEAGVNIRGSNILITPQEGYPALIVTGALDIDRTLRSLTVNGTCYVGSKITASGTIPAIPSLSTFTINGGLLVGAESGSPFPTSGYNIKTAINFDASKAKPLALKVPRGVSIFRWGLP